MTITVTFDPPLPSDSPATFNTKAFATLGDLNDWSTQANALAASVNADEAAAAASAASASLLAGDVSASVSTATTQAGIATTQAGIATTQAGIATTQTGIATTQAGIATAKAAEAAASAASIAPGSLLTAENPSYTGTLTGGTGVVNLGSGQLVKDAAGNIGIGVTPFAWGGLRKALDVLGFGAGLASNPGGNTDTNLSHNAYHNGTNWIYKSSSVSAGRYQIEGGAGGSVHSWHVSQPGTAGNAISFTQAMTLDASGHLTPGTDNAQTNGSGAKRWSVIYAGTGTINTSDAREKTPVRSLFDDEVQAAIALSKEVGVYQFLDSVRAKGDAARHHIGMTVQRAIEIMEHYGLDPFAYGFICYDKWDKETKEHPAIEAKEAVAAKDAVLDEEGNVIEPAVEAQPAVEAKDAWTEVTLEAGDRYSFRYDQLTLFIARGIDARLAALEAK